MLNLLKDMNSKADSYYAGLKEEKKSHYFYMFLFGTFICFILFGLVLGYLTGPQLNDEDMNQPAFNQPEEKYYEGRISYVDPMRYPGQNVSYILVDPNGKLLFLLKAQDQKLVVAEGHWGKLYGDISKSPTGEDILTVERVVLKQSN